MASTAPGVREAGVRERAQLSAALADALTDDPVFSWLLPSKRRRDARLRRLFALELEHWVFPPAGGRSRRTTSVARASSYRLAGRR